MISLPAAKRTVVVDDDEDNELIARLIDAARAYLENRNGTYYGQPVEEHVEYVRGMGTGTLFLSAPPQGESIEVTEHVLPGGDGSEVDEETFRIEGRKLRRLGGLVWTRGYEYAVTMARGYELDEGPADALQDAHRLVAYWYLNREAADRSVPADIEAGLISPRALVYA